jgi:seryl-tRNA synthetase
MFLGVDSVEIARAEYRQTLLDAGLLVDLGVPGVCGFTGAFERVIDELERAITRVGAETRAEVMRFPPLMSRPVYARTEHLETFPHLAGGVHAFQGRDEQAEEMIASKTGGGDWASRFTPTDLMLVPAACYPLYPTATGTLSADGRTVDLRSFVFRHEPSADPARLRVFRQREFVRLGSPAQAVTHRDRWLERSLALLRALGLPAVACVANDPFVGRGGRMLAASQREQTLKFELLVPITSQEHPTAVASCNYHLDHFGLAFDIHTPDGSPAHSACVEFGLERIALALFKTHGTDAERWPALVRRLLAA